MRLQNHRISELLGEIEEHIGCLKLECDEISDKLNTIRNEVGRIDEIFEIENAMSLVDGHFDDISDQIEILKAKFAER